ncbi:MAG: DUF4280 domain-containing protein [Rhodospirillales bacterium]
MPFHVCMGATLQCSFGAAPSKLAVLPQHRELTENMNAANIMDHAPNVNIMPFGLCAAPTNPQVAAATTAALGVLTPQPCVPATAAPWVPGSPTVILDQMPALNNTSQLLCTWLGVITVVDPGEHSVMIP